MGADQPENGAFEGTHTGAAGGGARDLAPAQSAAEAEENRLDALLPLGPSPIAARGAGKAGRPVGAKNRRTDLVAQYLVDRFGDPLTASMAIAGKPLPELVKDLRIVASDCGLKLGGTVMDILRFQRDCRNDALPYIHAKRAPETAKGDPVVPVIGIGRVEQVNNTVIVTGQSIEDALEARAKNVESDQGLIDAVANVSHDEMSHEEPSD